MKNATAYLSVALVCLMFAGSANAQQKADNADMLRALYGTNYEEVLSKYQDDPARLQAVQQDLQSDRYKTSSIDLIRSRSAQGDDDIGRAEAEPNNFFDTADDINDVIAMPGRTDEYTGKLIQASLTAGDVDVFKFTVDPTKMYYFASTHSFLDSGLDGLGVSARIFHESDLDTTFVVNANGIQGNDKMRGDITGRPADGRNGSGDFRLTGWTAPIVESTGEPLEGDYYLWIFNEGGDTGTYYITAYAIDIPTWVNKAEPNQTFEDALVNGITLPTDGVIRTYMLFNPDTVRVVSPSVPVQGNSVYPQLLEQGSEDRDHFLVNYEAGKTLIIETVPYFGWYRDNDGAIGPGGSRLDDPLFLIYDADYTTVLFESDDDGRERMDGPNNIHSRVVITPEAMAARGITSDTPIWLNMGAWASTTREPGRNVDNSDPGRFMYDLYATQYSTDPVEVEPNDEVATAQSIGPRPDTLINAGLSGASDVDMYRVYLHEVRMYTIFTSAAAADLGIEIFREEESADGSSTVLSDNLLDAGSIADMGNDVLVSGFVPEKTGAYLIKLTGAAAGDYKLGVVDKGQIYFGRIANEPDNVAEDALAQEAMGVGAGAAIKSGMIFPAGDVDHYHFTAEAGFDLSLSLTGTNADLVNDFNVEMTLFDGAFTELATGTGGISFTIPTTGQYIVQVKAVEDGDVGFYNLSGGQPFTETEGNDSFETANLLAIGNTYDASLTSGDVDYYTFVLEAGKLYSFRSLDNNTGGPLTVEFFDDVNGATLLDGSGWFNNYSGDNFKIANIIPRETRPYYLKISGGVGTYKVTSRVNPNYYALQSAGEPNNNAADADANGYYQAFGVDQEFALADPNHPRFFGDEDWFKVALTAGQVLVAETKPVSDFWNRDTDTKLVVYAADGVTELADDDDGGNDWYSRVSYAAAADGDVYVAVVTSRTPEGADDRSLNRGDYFLNIAVTSAEAEPNDTFATANALATGFLDATFETGVDSVDVFSLNLVADHIYHVRTLKTEVGYQGQFRARLFKGSDTATNLLDEANTGYNTRYSGSNLKLNIIPDETGEYLLEVTSTGGSGAYQIGMKGRDISELKALGEPNNTVAEADAIGTQSFNKPGEVLTSMLYNADFPWEAGDAITTRFGDDIDIYKYELVAGDTLIAETSPVDGPLWARDYDGFIRLLSAAGDTLLSDDDGGFDWHSRLQYIAAADEVVYVMVHSQDFGGATDSDPARGEYNLSVIKLDGTPITITDVEDLEQPQTFVLEQNYPNPFNPTTSINYSIPESVDVQLEVYNILGQRVATLVSGFQTSGTHSVVFDASQLASGVYLYRIAAGKYVSVKKMMLVK